MTHMEAWLTRAISYQKLSGVFVMLPAGTRIEVESDGTAWVYGDNIVIDASVYETKGVKKYGKNETEISV